MLSMLFSSLDLNVVNVILLSRETYKYLLDFFWYNKKILDG